MEQGARMNNNDLMITAFLTALLLVCCFWVIEIERKEAFNIGKVSAYQEVIRMCEGKYPLRLPDDVKRIDFEAHCVPFNYKR